MHIDLSDDIIFTEDLTYFSKTIINHILHIWKQQVFMRNDSGMFVCIKKYRLNNNKHAPV